MVGTRAEALDRPLGPGERVLRGHPHKFRLLPFLGPAFVACVAYIDPGNFATNVAGGSKFGFTLLWVIVASNLMAMLIQMLSAKLGIATGRNLPEVCREQFSRRTSLGLWIQAEGIAMATDLAEFLGAAIGFHLLLGIDLLPAALITAVAAFLILGLQRFGFRPFEAVIVMSLAGLINMAMLIMAATVFFKSGLKNVDSLEGAHKTLEPILGGASSVLFALALLASGLSSSAVGTLAGQVVMQGFIRRRISIFVRRAVTMLPALVVVAIGVDPSRTLVFSQVVLSFGIPFALIPLVLFTSKRRIMGVLTNHPVTTAVGSLVAALICALNLFLLAQTFGLI